MSKTYSRDPIEETRLLVLGLTGSGKSSILKALLGRNFDVTSSAAASKKMLFQPYQSLITYNDKRFIIKACDTRGLNDPNAKDSDTFEAIKNLYPSEFNLINRVLICFKQDRIRADVHTSIPVLLDYLKTSGLKKENVIVALTFMDGYKQEQIDDYIAEMKEHPLVGDLFTFASEIIITTLPELTTLAEDFQQVFEKRRDKIIETYYSTLSEYVQPVAIMTHEKFVEEIEKQKAKEIGKVEGLIDDICIENENLQFELNRKISEFEGVNKQIKASQKLGGRENDDKIVQLEQEKRKLTEEINRLKKESQPGCVIC